MGTVHESASIIKPFCASVAFAADVALDYISLHVVLEEWPMMQTRRVLLRQAVKFSAVLALDPKLLLGLTPGEPLALTIGSQPPSKLSANFTGLGFEMSS